VPSQFGFEKEIQKRLEWWNKLKQRQTKEQQKSSEEE
jgi:hypothetical protein